VSLRRVKSDQPDFASLNQITSPPAGLSHGRIAGFHLTAFALLDMVGALIWSHAISTLASSVRH
jgi:hypothetical protein